MKSIKIANSVTPVLFLPFLLLFAACSDELQSYASIQKIDKNGWPQQQEYTCIVLLNDSLSLYQVDITGRVKQSHLPDSLSFMVEVTAPSGRSFCDTLSFTVTPTRNRFWEDFRFPYCSRVRFSEPGAWRFSFMQNMDVVNLTGIMSIGVYIKKMQ